MVPAGTNSRSAVTTATAARANQARVFRVAIVSNQQPACANAQRLKRCAALARALDASTSRSRGGAFVTSPLISARAAFATSSTARANTASLDLDGFVKPLSLRTNWRDDARISSPVAGGVKLCSVLMLRHMDRPPRQRATAAVP